MSALPRTIQPVPDRIEARILLGLALVVGLVVFVRLGEWSLWIDEAFTLSDSLHQSAADNPVGYFVFGWFYRTMEALGGRPDEWTLRILPAVFGWLGIPLTYWAFRRSAGELVAAAAALLVATSSWHLYWSQNARFYTLVQDLCLLGAGFGLRALFREALTGRLLWLGLSLFFFGLATLAHPTAALVAAAFVGAPFLLLALRRWVPDAALPVAGPVAKVLGAVAVLGLLAAVIWVRPIYALWVSNKGGGTPVHLILTLGFFVTPVLGAATLFGAFDAFRRGSLFAVLASLVLILGTLAAIGVSFFARLTAQYLFAFLPWFCVLAAAPLAGLAPLAKSRERILAAALLGVLSLSGLTGEALYLSVRAGERPHWRAAYRYVWNQRGTDDQVFGMAGPVAQYYLDPTATELREVQALSYLNRWNVAAVRAWAREDRRAWFVLNREELLDWPSDSRAEFEAMLAADCRLMRSWPLYVESRDLSVEVYLRD